MGEHRRFVGLAAIVSAALFVAPSAFAQAAPQEVTVHLKATPDVTLERREDNDWVEVCFAPCDLKFPARGEYRVGGGIRDSDPFRLRETSPGLAVVAVDPRSRGGHAVGDVLIGIGSALTAGGAFTAFIGAAVGSCEGTHDQCSGSELVGPGLAVALVGVGVIVLGVDLAIVNGRSRVHPERGDLKPQSDVDRVGAMRFDLPKRREKEPIAPSTLASLPIVDVRF